MRRLPATAALCALALACNSHSDAPPANQYLGLVPFDTAVIRLVSAKDTVRLIAELAESETQKTMGLMERQTLGPDAGMLFLYSTVQPDSSAFWMFRTRIPLDIAFIDSTGVIRTEFNMPPCPSPLAQGCPGYPARTRFLAALEVNPGFLPHHHIGVGDRVLLGDTIARHKAKAH